MSEARNSVRCFQLCDLILSSMLGRGGVLVVAKGFLCFECEYTIVSISVSISAIPGD